MSEWELTCLGAVADLLMGQSPPGSSVRELQGGLPFLQGNAEFRQSHPRPRLECDCAPRVAEVGDSLISVRAPVGELNRADKRYGIGRGLAAVRFRAFDPGFGHHLLAQRAPDLHRVSQGTTFAAIGRAELSGLTVNVPPFKERQRITDILDTIDDSIRATERIIAKLTCALIGLRQELIPNRVGGEVVEVPLGQLVDPVRPIVYGILMPGDHEPGGVPVIKVKDIKNGAIADRRDLLHTSTSIDRQYARSRVRAGDLLFTIRGTVGRSAVVPIDLDAANITQDTARLAVKGVNPSYLLAAMHSERFRRFVDVHTIGQAVKGINLRELRQAPVLLAGREHQALVGAALDDADRLIRTEQQRLGKLRQERAGLAADLLSGRVRTVPL